MTISILKVAWYMPHILVVLSTLTSGQTSAPIDHPDIQGEDGGWVLVNRLRGISVTAHQSFEIQLRGTCQLNSETIKIPPISWGEAPGESDPLRTVQEVLSENKQLSVTRSAHTIVIRDAHVPQDLLDTTISGLRLDGHARYAADVAIYPALNSRAIRKALEKSNSREAVASLDGLLAINSADQPHLPRNIGRTTLRDYFSTVLATFGGFIVYEDCVDSGGVRRVYIRHY